MINKNRNNKTDIIKVLAICLLLMGTYFPIEYFNSQFNNRNLFTITAALALCPSEKPIWNIPYKPEKVTNETIKFSKKSEFNDYFLIFRFVFIHINGNFDFQKIFYLNKF